MRVVWDLIGVHIIGVVGGAQHPTIGKTNKVQMT